MTTPRCSRLFGPLLLFGALAAPAFSCTKVLDLEGHADAAKLLCEQYNACFDNPYPTCTATTSQRLRGADIATRTDWLQRFAVSPCLDACKQTYECMDNAPFCGGTGSPCEVLEGCCGFLSGTAECIAGACCVPDGIACNSTEDCCSSPCVGGTCGGQDCAAVDDDCSSDASCCGDLRCSSARQCFSCLPDGLECSVGDDCCNGRCLDGLCSSGCQPTDAACTSNDECCSNQCISVGDLSGLRCAGDTCLEDGSSCEQPGECCSQLCEANVCGGVLCKTEGELCKAGADCCSTKCVAHTSSSLDEGACCALPPDGLCPHDECKVGSPLDASCATNNGDAGCIAAICQADPFCCCQMWDATCVSQVPVQCGGQVCIQPPPNEG